MQGSFHTASGYPLVNASRFPSLKAMTDHAHALGLKAGWYGNNCGCEEHQRVPSWGAPASTAAGETDESLTDGIEHYRGDVQAIVDFGFDGIVRLRCFIDVSRCPLGPLANPGKYYFRSWTGVGPSAT